MCNNTSFLLWNEGRQSWPFCAQLVFVSVKFLVYWYIWFYFAKISNIFEKKCCTRRKKQVSNDTLTSPYYDRLSTTITIRCLVLGPKVLISKTRNQLKYISFKDSNVDSQAYQDNFIHIRLMFFFLLNLTLISLTIYIRVIIRG